MKDFGLNGSPSILKQSYTKDSHHSSGHESQDILFVMNIHRSHAIKEISPIIQDTLEPFNLLLCDGNGRFGSDLEKSI